MRLRLVLCPAAVLALVAGACSGDDDDSSSSDSRPPTSASATTTPRDTTTATTDDVPDLDNVHVKLTQVVSGLHNPVAFAIRKGDDDAFYIAEQHTGRVLRIMDGKVTGDPVLDIGGEVTQGNEQGLLGIAFSPDGTLLYIDYTDTHDVGDTHVQEFAMKGNVVDMTTRRNVLTIGDKFSNHNGGNIVFGPDNMLYLGMGDGGSAGDPDGNGQNRNVLLGKLLRFNPRASGNASYAVPADNPFVGQADARPEVWMYGLRNPWRYSFDRATGDLWIGDVGQGAWEEVDYAAAGVKGTNWGWDRREGAHSYEGEAPANAVDPILETSHKDGWCAIIGGYVYRGSAIPEMRGAYVFSDSCLGQVDAMTQRDGKLVSHRSLDINAGSASSFGEDAKGELYVLSLSGFVYRFDEA